MNILIKTVLNSNCKFQIPNKFNILNLNRSSIGRFNCLSQRRDFHFLSATNISSHKLKKYYEEKKAVHRLLERSGISYKDQLAILSHAIHLSASTNNRPTEPHPQNQKKSDEDKENKNNNTNPFYKLSLMFFVLYLMSVISMSLSNDDKQTENRYVSWNEFVHHMLAKGEVKEVIVKPHLNLVTIFLHDGAILKGKRNEKIAYHMNIVDLDSFETKLRAFEASLGIKPGQGVPVNYHHESGFGINTIIFALLALAFVSFFLRQTTSLEVKIKQVATKAKYTLIDPLSPGSGRGVKFSDVAGAHEAKQEVMEFVDFLNDPSKYQKLGAKVPKGALLLGPPGCGKTLLAKAVATEGGVPFLAMNGSEFIELVGGLGAARVRDLFKEAKKRAPAIIYIDEIDAIGRKRSANATHDSSEGEQTLNQLLVEMDGLLSKKGLIVLCSTNRVDVLDKALLRPGRFDRHIMMDYPTLEERREIFEHHLKSIILEKPVGFYSRRMASLTLGFSGADIANVVNEAALYAAREAKTLVSGGDLEYAVERVVGGTEKRSQVVSPEEKRIVAYHESGHALVGWLLKYTDALLKVTIVPRTNHALGFAQYTPKDQKLYTQEEMFERMCMALGGRVAESLTFNKVTTGAQNDLDKVTKMAYAQVRTFGFSDRVGKVSFPEAESTETGKRPYSQKLAATIDEEASKLIFDAYKRTEEVLKDNMDKLKLLAEALLQKESLTYEEVEVILGPPPHGQKVVIEPMEFENEIKNWSNATESG